MELHKSNDEYYIEIFYKRNRGEDVEPLEPLYIPNCGQKCTLSKMNELYHDIIPTGDFETECKIDNKPEPKWEPLLLFAGVMWSKMMKFKLIETFQVWR